VRLLRNIMGDDRWLKPLHHQTAIMRQIQLHWSDVMGALSTHFTADYIYKTDLVITACNPVWAAEIRYFTPMIVSKLQAFDPTITGLRVRMASPPRDALSVDSGQRVTNGSLLDVIRQDIEFKLANGFTWCRVCQAVLTKEESCVFCRCSGYSSFGMVESSRDGG